MLKIDESATLAESMKQIVAQPHPFITAIMDSDAYDLDKSIALIRQHKETLKDPSLTDEQIAAIAGHNRDTRIAAFTHPNFGPASARAIRSYTLLKEWTMAVSGNHMDPDDAVVGNYLIEMFSLTDFTGKSHDEFATISDSYLAALSSVINSYETPVPHWELLFQFVVTRVYYTVKSKLSDAFFTNEGANTVTARFIVIAAGYLSATQEEKLLWNILGTCNLRLLGQYARGHMDVRLPRVRAAVNRPRKKESKQFRDAIMEKEPSFLQLPLEWTFGLQPVSPFQA